MSEHFLQVASKSFSPVICKAKLITSLGFIAHTGLHSLCRASRAWGIIFNILFKLLSPTVFHQPIIYF